MSEYKTARQIVNEANELAKTFCEMFGFEASSGHKFHERLNPRDAGFWELAVAAYDHIEGTDVEDALYELEDS